MFYSSAVLRARIFLELSIILSSEHLTTAFVSCSFIRVCGVCFDLNSDFWSFGPLGLWILLFLDFSLNYFGKIPAKMSLARVHHPADIHSSHSSLATLSHSLEDIASWSYSAAETVLTIEELRDQLNCCFTCGVSWAESHVSLDCVECGGYALDRNCPKCEGACGAVWKRDLSTSHASGKAKWTGECLKSQKRECSTSPITQELSSRLERMSANS